MPKLGIISDTHGRVPDAVFDAFADVDAIIHAGDICAESVLWELESIAKTIAVLGKVRLRQRRARRAPSRDRRRAHLGGAFPGGRRRRGAIGRLWAGDPRAHAHPARRGDRVVPRAQPGQRLPSARRVQGKRHDRGGGRGQSRPVAPDRAVSGAAHPCDAKEGERPEGRSPSLFVQGERDANNTTPPKNKALNFNLPKILDRLRSLWSCGGRWAN